MAMAATAMFPLGTVLLPGGALPLQVFEPRYRQMVQDLLAGDEPPQFGVVMIERGHEVGGGDVRSEVGTLARVADIRALPDGRYALLAIGGERFKVTAWLPDDPYPQAEIELWPDEPTQLDEAELGELIDGVRHRVTALINEVRAARQMAPVTPPDVDDDPALAVHQLGAFAPVGPADRYRILAAPDLAARLDVLNAALDDAEAVLRFGSI